MILADKIIELRKKNGWSQEELAEMLQVSRQSVSKWEGAQSTPELDRIIQMSKIFSVSTDYLIKDEMEEVEHLAQEEPSGHLRRLSLEEANEFIALKEASIRPISLSVFSLILSPVLLIALGTIAEERLWPIEEGAATAIGVSFLLLVVAISVATLIYTGHRLEKYNFLEKENFETEYGVKGLISEKKEAFQDKYIKKLLLGISLCILSALPIFILFVLKGEDELYGGLSIVLLLVIVAIGVKQIIEAMIPKGAYEQILQEGDYSLKAKKANRIKGPLLGAYWILVVAIYLAYSFLTRRWEISWIIWPIAGLLSAVLSMILDLFTQDK